MSVVVTPGFWNRDSAIAALALAGIAAHVVARVAGASGVPLQLPLWVVLGPGVLVDGALAATYRFRDAPRPDSRAFIGHLAPRHQLNRVIIVPGGELSAY